MLSVSSRKPDVKIPGQLERFPCLSMRPLPDLKTSFLLCSSTHCIQGSKLAEAFLISEVHRFGVVSARINDQTNGHCGLSQLTVPGQRFLPSFSAMNCDHTLYDRWCFSLSREK